MSNYNVQRDLQLRLEKLERLVESLAVQVGKPSLAVDAGGASLMSFSAFSAPSDYGVPHEDGEPPVALDLQPMAEAVNVTWTAPGDVVEGYVVAYRADDEWEPTDAEEVDTTSAQITGLRPTTLYTVTVAPIRGGQRCTPATNLVKTTE